MQIRLMTIDDIPAATGIEAACFSSPWSADSFASSFSAGNTLFLLAEEAGRPAGYVGVQILPPDADLLNLAVLPDDRGKGFGRALLQRALTCCRERGVSLIGLEVRASNRAAQGLYTSVGFRPVGRRRRFYTDPVEDAVIMQLAL